MSPTLLHADPLSKLLIGLLQLLELLHVHQFLRRVVVTRVLLSKDIFEE